LERHLTRDAVAYENLLAEQGAKAVISLPQAAISLSLPVDGARLAAADRQLKFRTTSASLAAESSKVGAGINSCQSTMGDFRVDASVTTHL
jgi:hypothetical protein